MSTDKAGAEACYLLEENIYILANNFYFSGKTIFYDIARKSDVMVENFLPGKLDKLGVGYEMLSSMCPRLIYCAITGFGPTGPYAQKPG